MDTDDDSIRPSPGYWLEQGEAGAATPKGPCRVALKDIRIDGHPGSAPSSPSSKSTTPASAATSATSSSPADMQQDCVDPEMCRRLGLGCRPPLPPWGQAPGLPGRVSQLLQVLQGKKTVQEQGKGKQATSPAKSRAATYTWCWCHPPPSF